MVTVEPGVRAECPGGGMFYFFWYEIILWLWPLSGHSALVHTLKQSCRVFQLRCKPIMQTILI
jgi:hypothetical protein